MGIVIQDAEGSFVAAIRHAIQAPSVSATEALAILKGCEFGLEEGLQRLLNLIPMTLLALYRFRLRTADGRFSLI